MRTTVSREDIGLITATCLIAVAWTVFLPPLVVAGEDLQKTFTITSLWASVGALVSVLFVARWLFKRAFRSAIPYELSCLFGGIHTCWAMARWSWDGGNTNPSFIENMTLLSLQIAAVGVTTLVLFIGLNKRRSKPDEISRTAPSIRSLFVFWGGILSGVCVISMGLVIASGAGQDRARMRVQELHQIADVLKHNERLISDTEAVQAKLSALSRATQLDIQLMTSTDSLVNAGWKIVGGQASTWHRKTAQGLTLYATKRNTPYGALFVANTNTEFSHPVPTTQMIALLIAALLVLFAPLSSGFLGQELRRDLHGLNLALDHLKSNYDPTAHDELIERGTLATHEGEKLVQRVRAAYEMSVERRNELSQALTRARRDEDAKKNFLRTSIQILTRPIQEVQSHLVHLMNKGMSTNPELREDLVLVQESANQLKAYLDDLEQLADASSTTAMPRSYSVFDPAELIRHEIALARGRQAQGVTLTLIPPAEPLKLKGCRGQIVQVIRNLLSNALKYTPAGRIDLMVMTSNLADGCPCIEIVVRDTGLGIPADEHDAIFLDFYRGSETSHLPGTGIGLSLCRRIVKAHDGTIELVSSTGQGSSFSVKIPGLTT